MSRLLISYDPVLWDMTKFCFSKVWLNRTAIFLAKATSLVSKCALMRYCSTRYDCLECLIDMLQNPSNPSKCFKPCLKVEIWHKYTSLDIRPLDLASTSAGFQNRDFPNQTNGISLTIYSRKFLWRLSEWQNIKNTPLLILCRLIFESITVPVCWKHHAPTLIRCQCMPSDKHHG